MKNKLLYILIAAVFSLLAIISRGQTNPKFTSVDVPTFIEVIKDTNVVLLDVRTADEFAKGHISGTDFNIDMFSSNFMQEVLENIPKTKTTAIYCRSGNRSKRSGRALANEGYNVIELDRGYIGWLNTVK